jgi:hypothetical protein
MMHMRQGLRSQCGQSLAGNSCRGAVAGLVQRCLQRRDDQPAHQAGITEAHFRFCGMHIHIHEGGIAIEEQRQSRITVMRKVIGICATHRTDQQLVTHRASIDDKELHRGIGTVVSGQACEAADADVFAPAVDSDGIIGKIAPHHPP